MHAGPAGLRRGRRGATARRAATCPALDGLRAISVVAVLLYHADMLWIPGGFLGVEVFFVISGYLITMLLVREHDRTATISLRGFWLRRARRLLAAVYMLLATVSLDRARVLPRGRVEARRPGLGGADLRHELVPDRLRPVVLRGGRAAARVPAPLVAGDRGAVLPASGRSCCSACCALFRGRAAADGRRSSPPAPSPRWCGWPCCSSRPSTRAGRTTAPTPGRRACCSAPPWPCSGSPATPSAATPRSKSVAARPRRARRRRRDHRVLLVDRGDRDVPLPGRVRRAVGRDVRGHRRRRAPGTRARPAARAAGARLDRQALVLALPVALADLRVHAAGDRPAARRLPDARAAPRAHRRRRRAQLPLRRGADPQRRVHPLAPAPAAARRAGAGSPARSPSPGRPRLLLVAVSTVGASGSSGLDELVGQDDAAGDAPAPRRPPPATRSADGSPADAPDVDAARRRRWPRRCRRPRRRRRRRSSARSR